MYLILTEDNGHFGPTLVDKLESLNDTVNMFCEYTCDNSNEPVDLAEEIAATWDIINFGDYDYGRNTYGKVLVQVADYMIVEVDDEEDEE